MQLVRQAHDGTIVGAGSGSLLTFLNAHKLLIRYRSKSLCLGVRRRYQKKVVLVTNLFMMALE
jgi:hypothetical protein